LKIDQ